MIWDEGTNEMLDDVDPAAALKRGELRFTLDGRKLKGRRTLVRTGPRKWLPIPLAGSAAWHAMCPKTRA